MNGGSGSETMKLQQRVRELETSNEDLLDDKRSAELRLAEMEKELESRPSAAQTHKVVNSIFLFLFALHFVLRRPWKNCAPNQLPLKL